MQQSLIPGHNNNRHLTVEEIENNIGGLAITDNKLQELFDSLDVERTGYLPIGEVKKFYKGLEHYGLEPTDAEIESEMKKFAKSDENFMSYDEFCCLMLSFAQR
ncbi:EF-hand domain pair, putative [Trypanosoma equiperdum]|uniref:EF-hand domain-containing protein n=4 Tax=Trypanozoon TaxID=39700 RepID=Q383U3_TRYB2|nr:hypothetical protein, conserved [Trypanosoma brucei gambiense DAL972]XP_829050.1 hypothetical protein, conserved [Trypanosoma brucei brucei TREU927]RHW67963.1 EF-hand domain pair [Trypanosoma brucei equiperdum]SCU70283.1 EF-hand domain pair, putative [Trypanosoma equiperdum]EAN79938.1 hypothetical protein, conserved [Trypanosoma brucei brucei TREU927]CBH17990.1 hypothetical protein, conserved [Trypanosoma brucei gambiense DAL972]|eukprot:XP_011780254.1 hypothetical protein, conserved [Trypanosoma brucei gambiense DAL972]